MSGGHNPHRLPAAARRTAHCWHSEEGASGSGCTNLNRTFTAWNTPTRTRYGDKWFFSSALQYRLRSLLRISILFSPRLTFLIFFLKLNTMLHMDIYTYKYIYIIYQSYYIICCLCDQGYCKHNGDSTQTPCTKHSMRSVHLIPWSTSSTNLLSLDNFVQYDKKNPLQN